MEFERLIEGMAAAIAPEYIAQPEEVKTRILSARDAFLAIFLTSFDACARGTLPSPQTAPGIAPPPLLQAHIDVFAVRLRHLMASAKDPCIEPAAAMTAERIASFCNGKINQLPASGDVGYLGWRLAHQMTGTHDCSPHLLASICSLVKRHCGFTEDVFFDNEPNAAYRVERVKGWMLDELVRCADATADPPTLLKIFEQGSIRALDVREALLLTRAYCRVKGFVSHYSSFTHNPSRLRLRKYLPDLSLQMMQTVSHKLAEAAENFEARQIQRDIMVNWDYGRGGEVLASLRGRYIAPEFFQFVIRMIGLTLKEAGGQAGLDLEEVYYICDQRFRGNGEYERPLKDFLSGRIEGGALELARARAVAENEESTDAETRDSIFVKYSAKLVSWGVQDLDRLLVCLEGPVTRDQIHALVNLVCKLDGSTYKDIANECGKDPATLRHFWKSSTDKNTKLKQILIDFLRRKITVWKNRADFDLAREIRRLRRATGTAKSELVPAPYYATHISRRRRKRAREFLGAIDEEDSRSLGSIKKFVQRAYPKKTDSVIAEEIGVTVTVLLRALGRHETHETARIKEWLRLELERMAGT